MNFGFAIKTVRQSKGYNQKSFSEICGISQTALSQIETGLKKPKLRTIKKISQVTNTPEIVLYIIGMEQDAVPQRCKDMHGMIYPSLKNMLLQLVLTDQEELIRSIESSGLAEVA